MDSLEIVKILTPEVPRDKAEILIRYINDVKDANYLTQKDKLELIKEINDCKLKIAEVQQSLQKSADAQFKWLLGVMLTAIGLGLGFMYFIFTHIK